MAALTAASCPAAATAEQALTASAVPAAAATPPPRMTAQEAVCRVRQAEAEGLTLLKADSTSGYKGVYVDSSCKTRPYKAQVQRGGKRV